MNKEQIVYIAIIALLLIYIFHQKFNMTKPIIKENTRTLIKEKIKEKIVAKEKEVIKWKKAKSKIEYKKAFDTLATIDTVYIELLKCDSVVNIDNSIIANQATIISDQKEVIELTEADSRQIKKDLAKHKRKCFFTKVVAGVAIIVTVLLVK